MRGVAEHFSLGPTRCGGNRRAIRSTIVHHPTRECNPSLRSWTARDQGSLQLLFDSYALPNATLEHQVEHCSVVTWATSQRVFLPLFFLLDSHLKNDRLFALSTPTVSFPKPKDVSISRENEASRQTFPYFPRVRLTQLRLQERTIEKQTDTGKGLFCLLWYTGAGATTLDDAHCFRLQNPFCKIRLFDQLVLE